MMDKITNFNIVWYVLCWNEMPILPFMIDYWKKIATKVIVFDNNSTDGSVDYLKQYDWIEVRPYPISTGDQLNDDINRKIKNECWKEQKNNGVDFTIITDLDEILWAENLQERLSYAIEHDIDVLIPSGYDFVSQTFPKYLKDKLLHEQIRTCMRLPMWDKPIVLRPDYVNEINYEAGAHRAHPDSLVNMMYVDYLYLFHFKYLSSEYLIKKRFATATRMSDINKRNQWGIEYLYGKEQIEAQFNDRWKSAKLFSVYNLIKKNDNILICIFNYRHDENAKRWLSLLSPYFETVVLDSGNDHEEKDFMQFPNIYYSGLWDEMKKLSEKKNYDYVCQICSDVEIDDKNAELLINKLNLLSLNDGIGIWQPGVTENSRKNWTDTPLLLEDNCLISTNIIEGWMHVIRKDLLDKIPYIDTNENLYGYGVDIYESLTSTKNGYYNVRDTSVKVYNPDGTGYNSVLALKQGNVYLNSLLGRGISDYVDRYYAERISEYTVRRKHIDKNALVFLCNDNYIDYAGTLLSSFVENNKWFNGDVVIICDDKDFTFNDDSIKKLKKVYPSIKRRIAKTSDYAEILDKFKHYALRPQYLSCFYKYEIFKMPEYDKLLFLDCDMVVTSDISELFDIEDWISFCHDGVIEDGSYGGLNAGFILLNNKAREGSFYNDLISASKTIVLGGEFRGHIVGNLAEQDVLNMLFNNSANFLDKIYDSPNMGGSFEDVERRVREAKIIHYWAKPIPSNNPVIENMYHRVLWRQYHELFKNNLNKTNKEILLDLSRNEGVTSDDIINDFYSLDIQKDEADEISDILVNALKKRGEPNSKTLLLLYNRIVNNGFNYLEYVSWRTYLTHIEPISAHTNHEKNLVSFIIPNRGGTQIDKVVNNIKSLFDEDVCEIIVITQDDEDIFKKGQVYNAAVSKANGRYICLMDNDIINFRYINLIEIYEKYKKPFVAFNDITQIRYTSDTEYVKTSTMACPDGFGALLFVSKEYFIKHNGYSNLCFGWGAEDCIINLKLDGILRLNQDLGHITHKRRHNDHPGNTNINNRVCIMYGNSSFDNNKDGYDQTCFVTTYDYVDNDGVRRIGVKDFSVPANFEYMDIYNEQVEESKKLPKNACIVVPLFNENPSKEELKSFEQCLKVFNNRTIFTISKKGFDATKYKEVESSINGAFFFNYFLPEKYFDNDNGLLTLFKTPGFYDLFKDYEYMLRYDLTSYVFSDNLNNFTCTNIDYIAGPVFKIDENGKNMAHYADEDTFALMKISKMEELSEHATFDDYNIPNGIWFCEQQGATSADLRSSMPFSFYNEPYTCFITNEKKLPMGCAKFMDNYDNFWKYVINFE